LIESEKTSAKSRALRRIAQGGMSRKKFNASTRGWIKKLLNEKLIDTGRKWREIFPLYICYTFPLTLFSTLSGAAWFVLWFELFWLSSEADVGGFVSCFMFIGTYSISISMISGLIFDYAHVTFAAHTLQDYENLSRKTFLQLNWIFIRSKMANINFH
jgi:hypothetical protein